MKLILALPWYAGPDVDTFPLYFDIMMYFGALRERSLLYDRFKRQDHLDEFWRLLESLPTLDETGKDPRANPTREEWDRLSPLQIGICNYTRLSLVGRARELIVDSALEWDADWIFWWDHDMRFEHSTFMRLWRNNVPVCAALAFTARHPFHPVIYTVKEARFDPRNKATLTESSAPLLDYPRDKLVSNEDVGGEIAFGSGVMLTKVDVFKEIPKPWFACTGCGEDWFFCHRCGEYGIRKYVDTRVKTQHKEHNARWSDEEAYWRERELVPEAYENLMKALIVRE